MQKERIRWSANHYILSFFCISVIFFAKAKSDIIAVAIVILKPYGFSGIIFASQARVANITRHKPNITAKQYNSPQANRTGVILR